MAPRLAPAKKNSDAIVKRCAVYAEQPGRLADVAVGKLLGGVDVSPLPATQRGVETEMTTVAQLRQRQTGQVGVVPPLRRGDGG